MRHPGREEIHRRHPVLPLGPLPQESVPPRGITSSTRRLRISERHGLAASPTRFGVGRACESRQPPACKGAASPARRFGRRSSILIWTVLVVSSGGTVAVLHCCTRPLPIPIRLLRPLSAECPRAILGLVQPHIMDLSTSNSAPGEDGSKPCSISQRAATRLRHDHHARITSRSTSVP